MSDKPLAYYDTDGAVTIRASAIGKCSRALWASLNEISPVAPTERLEDIFQEGHLHERAVKELLESEGAIMDTAKDRGAREMMISVKNNNFALDYLLHPSRGGWVMK